MAERKHKRRQHLSKKQRRVLDDLFESGLDEAGVLAKHNVSSGLFRRWLGDELFAGELAFRIEQLQRQSELIISRYAPVAAMKLVELTASEKEETARKACLDIISLPFAGRSQTEPDTEFAPPPQLSPETASRLLAALARENSQ